MFTEQIIISKDEILTKYRNLDKKVKNIIQILYTIAEYAKEYQVENFDMRIKKVKIENIINENSKNSYKKYLDFVKEETGVYIFLDKNKKPAYIGFGGQVDKGQSLYERITSKQLSSNDTLIKNINEKEKCNLDISKLSYKRKELLLKYTSSLIIIDCGTQIEENVRFSQSLEVILIALFNPKYNK